MASSEHDAPANSDAAYVRRVQRGDRAAFRPLIERYERMVFSITNRFSETPADAEDLAQEVFMKAYSQIDRLRKPEQFASWLYGIALNRGRDYAKNIRRQTHAFSHTEQVDGDLPGEGLPQDAALEAEERSQQLWHALDQLSPTYATPFLLKYRDGMTYQAMADRMDLSVSALKVRVHRARKKLRGLLDNELDNEHTTERL